MGVINLNKRPYKQAPRDPVPIDASSDAARFFNRMIREIEVDLAGRRNLSRIERELITIFAGSATTLRYLNRQVLLGEIAELDLSAYSTMASTCLRIGSKLGLSRRTKLVEATLGDLLRDYQPDDADRHDPTEDRDDDAAASAN